MRTLNLFRPIRIWLLIVAAGCGKEVSVTAPGDGNLPALIVKVDSLKAAYPAGSILYPAVIVSDLQGRPVSGVSVRFAVTKGNGTVPAPSGSVSPRGNVAIITSDTNGLAQISGWILDNKAGRNELTVTVGVLAPVVFSVFGEIGAARYLQIVDGNNQKAEAGSAVKLPLSVRVTDAGGNPVGGASVTFVEDSYGSLEGSVAMSDSTGIARSGRWTLGPATGTQAITASLPGYNNDYYDGAYAHFFAVATVPYPHGCSATKALVIGLATTESLVESGCTLAGSYGAAFAFRLAEPVLIRMRSSSFSPLFYVLDANGRIVASNQYQSDNGQTAEVRLVGTAGDYTFVGSSMQHGGVGQFSVLADTGFVTHCGDEVSITRGAELSGELAYGDCDWSDYSTENWFADDFSIWLEEGQAVTLHFRSAFDAQLHVWPDVDAGNGSMQVSTGNDITVRYVAQAAGRYHMAVAPYRANTTGKYTLSVQ